MRMNRIASHTAYIYLFMSERVEHTVVGMNGGDIVLGELIVRYLHERLHSIFVIGPVANQLHAMRQVAVRVRKLGF